jgi:hypothetical protein
VPVGPKEREKAALQWLLDSGQPSVRYRVLTELQGRSPADPEVRRARAQLAKVGWAADLLKTQQPEGYFERRAPRSLKDWIDFLRFPAYDSTIWQGMVLADLGLTTADPRIRRLADQVMGHHLRTSSPFNLYYEEVCIVGNVARMLTQFGAGDDRRVRRLYAWMLEDQRADGGWNCAADRPGTLDAWEALAAFSVVPKPARSAAMERAIARGAEFYLARGLMRQGKPYAPWFRFHYPTHYFYDVLVGLDVVTRLGHAGDRRLRPALKLLDEKRRRDGTWAMDRIHPDEVPRPKRGADGKSIRPLALERAGARSYWITLTALAVQQRVREAT